MRFLASVFLTAGLLAGCAGRPPLQPTPDLTVLNDTSLPEPQRSDLVAADRVSLIGPLDNLRINVFNVEALSGEVRVDASGRVVLPLIGEVDARGKTPVELSRDIAGQLRGRFVRSPDVTVNIIESVSQVVTVDGEVEKPGAYPVSNQTTLMRAIASAEGVGEFAKLDDVVILRTVNGRRMAGLYNLTAIRRGAYPDPAVFANDVVVVGDSPARRLFRDIVSTAPLIAAPLVAVIN